MARSGLTIEEDPGLAWELVAALYNEGKIIQAREALARYQPRPGTQEETRLWMLLHLGASVTAEDARIMADLANRQPGGNYRDAIIALLIREVIPQPRGHTLPEGRRGHRRAPGRAGSAPPERPPPVHLRRGSLASRAGKGPA